MAVLPVVDAREMGPMLGGVVDIVMVSVEARWYTGRIDGLRECKACIGLILYAFAEFTRVLECCLEL